MAKTKILIIILAFSFAVSANIFAVAKAIAGEVNPRFVKTLQRGSRGDDVKQLQEFLKKSPDIYPEGLVTGYFGPLTEAAVKRLQEKYGIETIGIVGPKTRTKLNELIIKGTTLKKSEEKMPTSTQISPPEKESLNNEQLPQLLQWANENKIEIVDIDGGSLIAMHGIDQLFEGLKAIPLHLIKFLRGETVNLANRPCLNSATVVSDQAAKAKGVKKVIFLLCRGFGANTFAHEFGHVVDFIGIRNVEGNEFSFGKTDEGIRVLREEYDRIFLSEEYERMYQEQSFTAPPPGFISIYSARAQVENFADHFSAYIFQAQYFRERAVKEPLLAQKYNFLKTKIFLGKEY